MVRAGKALGSGAATAVQRLLSLFWMLLAAPGWLCLFSHFRNMFSFFFAIWADCVLILCMCFVFYVYIYIYNLFNLPSEGRQGTSVVSCSRMVPAGVSHVSPQRLLSDTVGTHPPSSIGLICL